jgi:hypothetical protein
MDSIMHELYYGLRSLVSGESIFRAQLVDKFFYGKRIYAFNEQCRLIM